MHGDARHRDLRRALPSASISAIAIPKSIDIAAWTGREREGILVVPRAGEMLYRLKPSCRPRLDVRSSRLCNRMRPIATIIEGRARDLGGFSVARLLPSAARSAASGRSSSSITWVRPSLPPGEGIDVRPHPHIGLATVTYLFEGEIVHRDSLGFVQPIEPGAINWMTAGRGIAHSERTGDALREGGLAAARPAALGGAAAGARGDRARRSRIIQRRRCPRSTSTACTLRVLVGRARTAPRRRCERSRRSFYVEARMPEGARSRAAAPNRPSAPPSS